MRYTICLITLLITVFTAIAQPQTAAVDSMKKALVNAKTTEDKVSTLDVLSRALMNMGRQAESEEYGNQLIGLAEESRDRKLMVQAYMSNGTRCGYAIGAKDYTNRSIGYFNKALTIAQQNKLEKETGSALLKLAAIHLTIPDKDKALNYVNQAFPVISNLDDDSLKAEANNTYGYVYLVKNDKIMALRYFLTGLRIAEGTHNASLLRSCYLNLSNFYSSIEDYDKAIDYYMLGNKKLDDVHEKNTPYLRATDLNSIGRLYAMKDNSDIAISYFERSLAMADSLKFPTLKISGYVSLLNQYLRLEQPLKALNYFNSSAGMALQDYLNDFGLSAAVDQAYGVIYTKLGKFDSAKYYFDKAAPYFENTTNEGYKIAFFAQQGNYYEKTKEYSKAIELYLKVKDIADKTGQLEFVEKAAKHLDTLYARSGDYQKASIYSSIYYKYKDSIEKLNKEKELAQLEAADAEQRTARLEKEKAERKIRMNNIQYMGITIGIVALFISLVVLGMFKVSATTIKMIGFFAFLMFFEFIFLVFKKSIYSITHGEPWKDLLFMIALAAALLPLHHWLEGKVIHYLTSHNRLTAAGHHIKNRLFRRKSENQ